MGPVAREPKRAATGGAEVSLRSKDEARGYKREGVEVDGADCSKRRGNSVGVGHGTEETLGVETGTTVTINRSEKPRGCRELSTQKPVYRKRESAIQANRCDATRRLLLRATLTLGPGVARIRPPVPKLYVAAARG